MKLFKKVICIVLTLTCLLTAMSLPSSAAGEGFMKGMDKGYVTFIFDDNRDCTAELLTLFKKYNMPLSCAVIAEKVEKSTSIQKTLKEVQEAGGEILSHTYSHYVFTDTNFDINKVEEEFSKSYRVLTDLGFNVNGVIETGNGGGEAKAPKDKIETVTKKYYKYSNAYGVSPQYTCTRTWLSSGLSSVKNKLKKAAENNEWVILSAHDFSEMKKEVLENLLQYISSNDKLEVVTWNYMYRTFGTNPDPITPTKAVATTQTPENNSGTTNNPSTDNKQENGTTNNPSNNNSTTNTPSTDTPTVNNPDTPTVNNPDTTTPSGDANNTTNSDTTIIIDGGEETSLGYLPFVIAGVAVLLLAGAVVTVIIVNKKSKAKK